MIDLVLNTPALYAKKSISFLFPFRKKKVGEVNKDSGNMLPYAFPEAVLHVIRSIVPGDIKGEIREV